MLRGSQRMPPVPETQQGCEIENSKTNLDASCCGHIGLLWSAASAKTPHPINDDFGICYEEVARTEGGEVLGHCLIQIREAVVQIVDAEPFQDPVPNCIP